MGISGTAAAIVAVVISAVITVIVMLELHNAVKATVHAVRREKQWKK